MATWRVEIEPAGTVPLADFDVEVITYTRAIGRDSALVECDEATAADPGGHPGVVTIEPEAHSQA